VVAELERIGGPAQLFDVPLEGLRVPCLDFPLEMVRPVLAKWAPEGAAVDRLWPWVAGACYHWASAQQRRRSSLRPTDVKRKLGDIATHAAAISDDLHVLLSAALSRVLTDREQPAQIDRLLAYLAVGISPGDARADTLATLVDFRRRLMGVAIVAAAAADVLEHGSPERAALARKKPPRDVALADFVWVLAHVWRSLTGYEPTVDEDRATGEPPDFVRFVQAAAGLVVARNPDTMDVPSKDTIDRAFKSTRIPSEK
jgi:hypothetical protein